MLIEERERMINELISDSHSTQEELSNVTDDDLEIFYNSCYEIKEDEIDETDEVHDLIDLLKQEVEKLASDNAPEWIENIPDEEIKQIAIDKYKVTPKQILEIVEKLVQAYEQR